MNNEKKQAPRCPYCDAEMRLEDNEDVLFGLFADEERMYWYQCNTPLCGIHSPAKHTKVGAYIAAMSRWQGPNRVLTLDEVLVTAYDDCNTEQETVMYLEYREDYEGYAIVTDLEMDGSKILFEFSGIGGVQRVQEVRRCAKPWKVLIKPLCGGITVQIVCCLSLRLKPDWASACAWKNATMMRIRVLGVGL